MDKRVKKALKGGMSIRKEIEKHFKKLEQDIKENNLERGRYHWKELNFSFLPVLEKKIKLAGLGEKEERELSEYRKRLSELRKKVNL